jgi:hypothetical protein
VPRAGSLGSGSYMIYISPPAQTLEGTGAADDRPRARLSQVLRHSLRHFGRYGHPHSALRAGDRPGDQRHFGIGAPVGVQNGPANAERRAPKGGPLQDFARTPEQAAASWRGAPSPSALNDPYA